MSFKSRYLSEETGQTISNEINKATTFATEMGNRATQAQPTGISQAAKVATITPTQSIIKTSEAEDDLNRSSVGNQKPNPTANDAAKSDRVLSTEGIRSTRESSRTPFNVNITESISIDIDARIPGPFDNKLTAKLKSVGLNTGVSKTDVSPGSDSAKTGQKNINSGTKASFTLGANDAGKQAKDGLKTAMNVPGKEDVKKTMMTDSTIIKIAKLVEEYTNADVQSTSGPVKHSSVPKGQGVQPGNHANQSMAQTRAMNDISEDKMDKATSLRKMTAPEVGRDYAAEHTTGLKADQYKSKYQTDATNAQTSAQREERLSSEAGAQQGGA